MITIKQILQRHALKIRQKKFKKHGLHPEDVTILSSNCWGGELYHDAGMRFLSPTINLTFDPLDFITFINRIEEIRSSTMVEENTDKPYPVGLLKYSDGKYIRVYFVHYNSFEDAKEFFYKRAMRITDKIVVLLMVKNLSKLVIEAFDSIPYKKICIFGDTSEQISNNSSFVQFKKLLLQRKMSYRLNHI